MTVLQERPRDLADDAADAPRPVDPGLALEDQAFRFTITGIGLVVLAVTAMIATFLGLTAIPTFRRYGWSFLTEHQWLPDRDVIGISGVVLGTFTVALTAMLFAFPLALSVALYVTQYAPPRLRSTFTSLVDLMAAVPSIIFGLWGRDVLADHGIHVANFLQRHVGWFPLFHVNTDADAPLLSGSAYAGSAFLAGTVVSLMVLPMAAAVMIGVFNQAPIGEREAAMALGSTRWGVVRTVVLPFGRGGIIGGTMLALGRALGETIAVVLIVSAASDLKVRPLESGGNTVSALIAGRFGSATSAQLSALLTAGFVLFLITLVTNSLAAVIVNRSRSGAGTDG